MHHPKWPVSDIVTMLAGTLLVLVAILIGIDCRSLASLPTAHEDSQSRTPAGELPPSGGIPARNAESSEMYTAVEQSLRFSSDRTIARSETTDAELPTYRISSTQEFDPQNTYHG